MKPKYLVYSLLALILGGQLFAIATDIESWPFSPYPMYADAIEPANSNYVAVRLFGVMKGKPPREVALDAAFMRKSLARLSRRGAWQKELRHALVLYVRQYGWRRPQDSHSKPPTLNALRVYRQTWNVHAGKIDQTAPPDQSELLYELNPSNFADDPSIPH